MFPISDENKSLTTPVVNYALIVINTVVFLYFYLTLSPSEYQAFVYRYGVVPLYILRGERLYTLFTSMFLHANLLHIAGNMLYLYIFGDNVEDAMGHVAYLFFYLASGIGASLFHIASLFFVNEAYRAVALRVPAIGASGAISGVLGAYMVLYPRARIRTLVFTFIITIISIPAYLYIGFWFIYQLLYGILSLQQPASVAFWAHIGGFITGIILVKLAGVKPRRLYRYYYRWRALYSPWLPG